jgi:class 3 adenylate cyclase
MNTTRRLAAILAADVAGYSRLMGADEEGTLERLKALRREHLDPKIAEHQGRIPGLRPGDQTTGDGILTDEIYAPGNRLTTATDAVSPWGSRRRASTRTCRARRHRTR